MVFPYAQKNPPDSFPAVSVILIAVNVIIFLFTNDYGLIREDVVDSWAVSASNLSPLTIATSTFLHADPFHLLGNMWFLYLFGWAVEGRMKTWRFILLYIVAAVGSTFVQMLVAGGDVPQIGASGAIMGVMGAALYLFPFAKVKVFYWFFITMMGTWLIPVWGVAIYYVAIDLLFGSVGLAAGEGGGGTAHFAHLGGVLFGLVVPLILRVKRDNSYVSDAKEALHDMGDYRVLNAHQLFDLSQVKPDDPEVALAWMSAELKYGTVSQECLKHFERHLTYLAREGKIEDVSHVLQNLVMSHHSVNPVLVALVARRNEDAHYPRFAMLLYDHVMRDGKSSDSDREMATYRLASLHERMGDGTTAGHLYGQYLQFWPMGAMEQSSKAGLLRLKARGL